MQSHIRRTFLVALACTVLMPASALAVREDSMTKHDARTSRVSPLGSPPPAMR